MPQDQTITYQISTKFGATAAVITNMEGIVIDAAPVLKWMLGKHTDDCFKWGQIDSVTRIENVSAVGDVWQWRRLKGYPVSHLTRYAKNENLESLCGLVRNTRKVLVDRGIGEFDATIKCAKCLRQHTDGEAQPLF